MFNQGQAEIRNNLRQFFRRSQSRGKCRIVDGAPWLWKRLDWVITRVGLDPSPVVEMLDWRDVVHHVSVALAALPLAEGQRKELYIDTMEISPDGAGLRPRSRFARFTNLPELQQMFRAFTDVQTAEMLNLPRPELETGKPIVHACPMSDEQRALQQELVERYERLR